jgi:hypothetical protein
MATKGLTSGSVLESSLNPGLNPGRSIPPAAFPERLAYHIDTLEAALFQAGLIGVRHPAGEVESESKNDLIENCLVDIPCLGKLLGTVGSLQRQPDRTWFHLDLKNHL